MWGVYKHFLELQKSICKLFALSETHCSLFYINFQFISLYWVYKSIFLSGEIHGRSFYHSLIIFQTFTQSTEYKSSVNQKQAKGDNLCEKLFCDLDTSWFRALPYMSQLPYIIHINSRIVFLDIPGKYVLSCNSLLLSSIYAKWNCPC